MLSVFMSSFSCLLLLTWLRSWLCTPLRSQPPRRTDLRSFLQMAHGVFAQRLSFLFSLAIFVFGTSRCQLSQ